MRQLVTWRFWLTIVVLVALPVGLWVVVRDEVGADPATVAEVEATALPQGGRRIDLILPVFGAQADPGFAIVDGLTTASMVLGIDGFRTVKIAPGTPGENRCPDLDELVRCAVALDLLGDAVMWFSIVPRGPRDTVQLPAPREFLDGDRLLLANGWSVVHAPRVKRNCAEETSSLSEFMRTFGDAVTTSYGFAAQAIVAVTCEQ
jgi:hypothetical protein